MQNKPEISFKCGPYALQQILLSDQRLLASSPTNAMMEIFNSASTQKGFSLPQVAELSKKVGLNYQMAFRVGALASRQRIADEAASRRGDQRGDFIVPSVVHWKVGHYAAMVRQEGDRYLLEDPTFGNTVWATRQALEAETSGYFLIPPGDLPRGWRSVDAKEGAAIWGKGHDRRQRSRLRIGPNDPEEARACAVATAHGHGGVQRPSHAGQFEHHGHTGRLHRRRWARRFSSRYATTSAMPFSRPTSPTPTSARSGPAIGFRTSRTIPQSPWRM